MIEPGTKVKVHYKGTLDDGSVFDTSENRDPLEFQLGAGQVIPGFNDAVQEMEIGGTKTITSPSEQAYGDRRDNLILKIKNQQIPDGLEPKIGQKLELTTPQGPLPVHVTDISDERIVIDGNHPLAGKDLTFELTLVEAG